MDRIRFAEACAHLGLKLTSAQLEAFEAFEDRLYHTNTITNLTRIPIEECWLRHFVDSLLFQDLIPKNARLLDIGTGPGFPAFPLACARPDLQVTALDSAGKMTGFLKTVAPKNLRVVTDRAEEWQVRDLFNVVTGRAVAPLATQLELSAAPCVLNGLLIPMRTPAEKEQFDCPAAKTLGLKLERVEERQLEGTDVIRTFPVYRKVAPTPTKYPRRWADIKKAPLG